MSRFCWIDLAEAAVRLSATDDDVRQMIEDGTLRARTFDGSEFVVRSDEVELLADIFTVNKASLRGPHARKVPR
jgi:excisionase family DNA binding protein